MEQEAIISTARKLKNRTLKVLDGEDVQIIENDDEYHYAVGMMYSLLIQSRPDYKIMKRGVINNLLQAPNDESIKKRFSNDFIKINQLAFVESWKGVLLSTIMEYKPEIETSRKPSKSHQMMIAGFTTHIN